MFGRWIVLATAMAVFAVPLQAAETYTDPKALVAAIYADYGPGKTAPDPVQFYSTRLKAVFAQAEENAVFADDAAQHGTPSAQQVRFNPFVPDDNALIYDLAIGEPTLLNDRAIIPVSYHNFDQPRLLSIALVREGDAWTVDDVAALSGDQTWLLSWALTYDPLGF